MWRVSRLDFYAAAIALVAVLLLGILQGILLAALASVVLLLIRRRVRMSRFSAAFPARTAIPTSPVIRKTRRCPASWLSGPRRHCSTSMPTLCWRRFSAASRAADAAGIRLVVCDLSASPYIDLAGSSMLHELHGELARRGIALRIVGARGRVRDLLRADGLAEKVEGLQRDTTLHGLLEGPG